MLTLESLYPFFKAQSDPHLQIDLRTSPPRQRRTSSLFLEHIFRASLTSTTTKSAIPGSYHIYVSWKLPLSVKGKIYEAHCIRDDKAVAQIVVNFGFDRDGIPDFEQNEVTKIIDVLQETFLGQLNFTDKRNFWTLAITSKDKRDEKTESFSEAQIEELFNDIMLKKLEEHKQHLTVKTIAEMRSYTVPNSVIKTVISSILTLIRPGKDDIGTDRDVSTLSLVFASPIIRSAFKNWFLKFRNRFLQMMNSELFECSVAINAELRSDEGGFERNKSNSEKSLGIFRQSTDRFDFPIRLTANGLRLPMAVRACLHSRVAKKRLKENYICVHTPGLT